MQQRNIENIKLIFKHTHRDHKLKGQDGSLCVTYPAPYFGLGSIENMPQDAFDRALANAKRKETAAVVESKLKPIMTKFGLIEHFMGTMQWRDNLESVMKYASFALRSETIINQLRAEIEAANIQFNG